MRYNLNWLFGEIEQGKDFDYLFFWGHKSSKNELLTSSCFSQWWISPFIANSVKYETAEHWMMAQKAVLFKDLETYQKIINAKTPKEAKVFGREVKNFDERIWQQKREEIVVQGSCYKFRQNKDLKDFLINTKNKVLVEASPIDKIWGVGLEKDNELVKNPKTWKGLNLLGFALMEARNILDDE